MEISNECCICFETDWVMRTPCQHLLCLKCLLILTEDKCPCCRQPFRHTLPPKILTILKNVSNLNNSSSSLVDVNDHYQFPPLGQ